MIHSSPAEHTVLYDPLLHNQEGELRHLLSWIRERRGAGDPPATQVLVELWPLDKAKLEDALNDMAKRELIGRDGD